MRNLEDIERDLAAARETLSSVKGTPAEVYSRIVGYYRSVRNWNRGKREEYSERRLFSISGNELNAAAAVSPSYGNTNARTLTSQHSQELDFATTPAEVFSAEVSPDRNDERVLLFVRSSCPGCPPAKAAALQLGIPLDMVNADTADGMAEAVRRNVLSTPTAILISSHGEELRRAGDAETIGRLLQHAV